MSILTELIHKDNIWEQDFKDFFSSVSVSETMLTLRKKYSVPHLICEYIEKVATTIPKKIKGGDAHAI